jgi:PBP1b-binding outer membrane lipoprotein LpoB
MKKLFSILSLAVMLVACSKEAVDLKTQAAAPPPETTPKDQYFSRVRYFHDNRTPEVDTVWTLHLIDSNMVAHYTAQNGYIYADSRIVTEKGVLWQK